MELEVSYLIANTNLTLTADANSHIAGEVSCARMGPKKLVGAQEASPAGYVTSKALYMIIKSLIDLSL